MALNMQTFRTRALTSLVFVLVMFAGLLWSYWSFFILFSIIHFGCWMEYHYLMGRIDKEYGQITPFHKYGVMIAGGCLLLYFTSDAFSVFGLKLPAIGLWLGLIAAFVLPIIELLFARQVELKNIGYSALGLLYISLSLGLMMDLRCYGIKLNPDGTYSDALAFALPLILVIALWINDTMAYLVGSFIGKTPLTRISPKKTWEGTLGGVILCIGIMIAAGYITSLFRTQDWAIIGFIVAVTATAGDLLESKLKRMAGVKDSGSLMPGHGGFLDRFDSLLIATPFVWAYVNLFM
ncbi:MAG: phosphatidate cytidylyltransferase [Chitinophagaceae bacterium]|nr:phosphatidate cytidylyltransferase [Chitinophagaceae bacterium]